MDDPLMWTLLPLQHYFNPSNMRWSLGAHDICFKNKILSTFFTLGQVLPTHRLEHSPLGGIFQPTMTEAIRLLSVPGPGSSVPHRLPQTSPAGSHPPSYPAHDPFSSPTHFYTTTGHDRVPAPSTYRQNRHAWIHVFPEARVHQHPHRSMRYFRWGIARLILEADRCPDLVPMWIEGTDHILPEDRAGPRWLPRVGKRVGVWIGAVVRGADAEAQLGSAKAFGDLRGRWRALVERENARRQPRAIGEDGEDELGVLECKELRDGKDAMQLRMDCAMEVRKLVLGVRRDRGLSDEDPKAGRAETWKQEGARRSGEMKDGSWVSDAG